MDRKPPAGSPSGSTFLNVAVASIVVGGLALLLARMSVLDYGAVIAPAVAGLLVIMVFVVRARFPAGWERSLLTLIGGGLLFVGLVFLGVLVFLLIALSNRGE